MIYAFKWGHVLPTPSSVSMDYETLGVQKRVWSGRLSTVVYPEENKRKWTVTWDGAAAVERDSILTAWTRHWAAGEDLYMMDHVSVPVDNPTSSTFEAKSSKDGYKEVKRYNKFYKHWRYKITLVLLEN